MFLGPNLAPILVGVGNTIDKEGGILYKKKLSRYDN